MAAAIAERTMPKQKPAVELEGVKIEKPLLDKARVAFNYIKGRKADPRNYTLAAYLSECLRGERSLLDDHAAYIREEARKLAKPKD